MYPKYKCQALIKEYGPLFIKRLGIKGKVRFTVIRSDSKEAKAKSVNYSNHKGLSFINSDGDADIIIYYDTHHSEKDALGTIIHELLHVAIYKISGLITTNTEKAYKEEENFIRRLEVIILDLIYGRL